MYLCMKLWGLGSNLTPLRQRCSIFNERDYAKLFLVLLTYPFHTEMPENNNWGKIISMCLQYSQYYKLANIAFLIYTQQQELSIQIMMMSFADEYIKDKLIPH